MQGLDEKEWEPFEIQNIFTIDSGFRLESRNRKPGSRPFIGALDNSNGIVEFVSDTNASLDSNVLGVNYDGNGMGIGFYHPYECIFSDSVKRFHWKDIEDKEELALFAKTMIEKQRSKFDYLYKFNAKRMAATSIELPVKDDKQPDFSYMQEYIQECRRQKLQQYIQYVEKRIEELGDYADILSLHECLWNEFRIGDLFSISRPAARNKDAYETGGVPFVASGAVNNGVMKLCSPMNGEKLDIGNCITVSPVDGSAFYQPMNFLGRGGAGSSILMLRADFLNVFVGEFIARLIQQTTSKYTYGHMGNKDSIGRERIMLPVDDTGAPDFEYMEQYSKNMMLRKYQQYLNFLNCKND